MFNHHVTKMYEEFIEDLLKLESLSWSCRRFMLVRYLAKVKFRKIIITPAGVYSIHLLGKIMFSLLIPHSSALPTCWVQFETLQILTIR